jgi:hypothetical protein
MKNSNATIENRTRDLPSCSAVPQPTAPPCAPGIFVKHFLYGHRYIQKEEIRMLTNRYVSINELLCLSLYVHMTQTSTCAKIFIVAL